MEKSFIPEIGCTPSPSQVCFAQKSFLQGQPEEKESGSAYWAFATFTFFAVSCAAIAFLIWIDGGEARGDGKTLDISMGGSTIDMSVALAQGSMIRLELQVAEKQRLQRLIRSLLTLHWQ